MLQAIKEFFSGDSNKLELGMDPQIYTNAPSPDTRKIDSRDNKYHSDFVTDNTCKNLEQVFASNIFAKILKKLIDSKMKEGKPLSIETSSSSLTAIIQKLQNKKDIFDGIIFSHEEIKTLKSFLGDISSEDMKHIIEIYTKITPKSGKRKDQKAMEAFVALTHPNNIKSHVEKAIDGKDRFIKSHNSEVSDFFSYLDSGEKSLKDIAKYETWTKKLIASKSKSGHTASIYRIQNAFFNVKRGDEMVKSGTMNYGLYLVIDNQRMSGSFKIGYDGSDEFENLQMFEDFIVIDSTGGCRIIAFNGKRHHVGSFLGEENGEYVCVDSRRKGRERFDKNRNFLRGYGWR